MTYNRHFILFALVFLLVGGSSATAQEMGSPSFENYSSDSNADYETTETDPADPPKQTVQSSSKDSSQTVFQRNVYKPAPAVPKDERKTEHQDDDSILSFNFLYYLIQKYKMQDIVD